MNEITESLEAIASQEPSMDDYTRLREAAKLLAVFALENLTGDTRKAALAVSDGIARFCNMAIDGSED